MYALLRTDKANDQLYSIIQYIAEDSGSVDIALNYLDKMEAEIGKLRMTPHTGGYPRYSTLKRQGYRVLIVQRYLVFYKVDDGRQQVIIYAIVDSRQRYLNLI